MSDIPDYRSRVNTDILRLIPPDCKSVLEIGCGDGSLYTAYRRINPDCIWCAVEKDTEARVAAYKAGVKIIGDDAELCFADDINPWKEDIDCLVIGDTIEHLRDPWTVLKNAARCVKPSGQVIACIPNIAHHSVIVSLLQARWDYQDEGLFDENHLRNFTLKSIREMFALADLQIFNVRGRCFGNEHHQAFMERAKVFGGWAGIDLEKLDHESRVYQYVVRAIKPQWHKVVDPIEGTVDVAPAIKPLSIHAQLGELCCARPRIIEPIAAIETIPGVKIVGAKDKPNIVIIQRDRWASRMIDIYKSILMDGSLLIAEIDDNPESLEGIPESDFMSLRAVHAIQCSTERLADTCRRWNPNVMVFPNVIAELPPPRKPLVVASLGVIPKPWIFFGAQNRRSDWEPIMPTLNQVLADHDVRFEVVHDQEFYHALEIKPVTDSISCGKNFSPWLDYPEYRKMLRSCDIALLPLQSTPFNLMKSDIGFVEAAAEGCCVLASNVVYFDSIYSSGEDCVRGMTFATPDEFRCNLRILIDSSELRRVMAESAYRYVRDNRMLGQHFRKRYDWYQSLLTRKAELDKSLFERVPQLQSNVKTS